MYKRLSSFLEAVLIVLNEFLPAVALIAVSFLSPISELFWPVSGGGAIQHRHYEDVGFEGYRADDVLSCLRELFLHGDVLICRVTPVHRDDAGLTDCIQHAARNYVGARPDGFSHDRDKSSAKVNMQNIRIGTTTESAKGMSSCDCGANIRRLRASCADPRQ